MFYRIYRSKKVVVLSGRILESSKRMGGTTGRSVQHKIGIGLFRLIFYVRNQSFKFVWTWLIRYSLVRMKKVETGK